MIPASQTLSPEVRAPLTELEALQRHATETRGILDSLCKLLIEGGLVSAQLLSAATHRRSFAEARRRHPCQWSTSLGCVLRSKDVAVKVASFFINMTDSAGLRTASRTFDTCQAEAFSAMARPKVLVWRAAFFDPAAFDVFDPVTHAWDTIPSTHQPDEYATSSVIDGRLYVCGGFLVSALDRFDPRRGTWQSLPPMSQARGSHAAAAVGSRLYVCGGFSSIELLDDEVSFELVDGANKTAECFDTVTNVWQALPAMVHERNYARAAVIRNHVYLVGGAPLSDFSSERLLPTGHWQELPRMHHGRCGFETAVVADRLYVCGGNDQRSVERFDPEAGLWELLQPMFEQHIGGAFVVLHGQLYMCGGTDGDVGGYGSSRSSSTVERFNPTRNTWERVAPMTCSSIISVAVVIDGRLFVCGKVPESEEDGYDTAEWFDPATGHWEFLRDLGYLAFCDKVFVMSC